MAYEQLKNSALPRALSDVVGDLADLFEKEMRLSRAEISSKLSMKIRAGAWMSIAAALGVIALLLLIEAAVFAIAAYGIPLHWACVIVAAVLGLVAAAFYAKGRADAQEDLMPTRTIHQVKQDIATAKEQLT
jgi:Putative Actinobacterial Holin-X, holin superfamily III